MRIGSKLGLCNYKEDAYLNKLRGVVCVNTGKYYKSITSAGNDTNIRISLIFGCCKHDYFTAGSDENSNPLVWMYEEEYQELINNNVDIDDYVNNQINKRWQVLSKKVICLNTLEVFEAKNASEWCGVSKDCIYSCCRGRTKTSGKNPETGERLKWMYYDDFIKLSQEEQNIISIH